MERRGSTGGEPSCFTCFRLTVLLDEGIFLEPPPLEVLVFDAFEFELAMSDRLAAVLTLFRRDSLLLSFLNGSFK
jgi:hypothetical protein